MQGRTTNTSFDINQRSLVKVSMFVHTSPSESSYINHHQPPSTIINHHRPPSTLILPNGCLKPPQPIFFSGRGHDELLLDGNRAQNLRGNSGVGSILGRLKPPKKHGNHSHNHHNPIFGRLNLYYNHNHNNNPIMIIFVFICGRLIQIQS